QAEDGIRDFHVTGVQTCALPIFIVDATRASGKLRPKTRNDARILGVGIWPLTMDELRRQRDARAAAVKAATEALGAEPVLGWRRSEERRVGKEGRARWWRCRGKR